MFDLHSEVDKIVRVLARGCVSTSYDAAQWVPLHNEFHRVATECIARAAIPDRPELEAAAERIHAHLTDVMQSGVPFEPACMVPFPINYRQFLPKPFEDPQIKDLVSKVLEVAIRIGTELNQQQATQIAWHVTDPDHPTPDLFELCSRLETAYQACDRNPLLDMVNRVHFIERLAAYLKLSDENLRKAALKVELSHAWNPDERTSGYSFWNKLRDGDQSVAHFVCKALHSKPYVQYLAILSKVAALFRKGYQEPTPQQGIPPNQHFERLCTDFACPELRAALPLDSGLITPAHPRRVPMHECQLRAWLWGEMIETHLKSLAIQLPSRQIAPNPRRFLFALFTPFRTTWVGGGESKWYTDAPTRDQLARWTRFLLKHLAGDPLARRIQAIKP